MKPVCVVPSGRYTGRAVEPTIPRDSAGVDRLLVERFLKHRREDDFRELYRSKTPRLMMFALRLCGGNPHEAEDLVQETWVRACTALAQFRWNSALSTWLCGIAVNCYRERLRIAPTIPLENDVAIPVPPGGGSDLEELITHLPERCREVVVLHLIHGYSHSEVASMLKIADATSRHHLFRARQILSSWLSPCDTEMEK